MSTTTPGAESDRAPLPPERRTLVVVLATLEGLLLVAASVLASLSGPPPGPAHGPFDTTADGGLVAAAVCASVALLVLPPVLGALSRRWQTALAVPSIPLWLALLAEVALAFISKAGAFRLYQTGGVYGDLFYVGAVVANVAGPLLTVLYLVVGLGGLGWLARRAFAR